jgi:hypothetical protein
MTTQQHAIARPRLMLKESTAQDFEALGVGEAMLDGPETMPPLPPQFTIRSEMTPVEDQGFQGSCTSFCVAACLEHLHQRDLSEAQITHESERAYGDCTEGLAVLHAYQTCQTPGSVDEALWRYDPAQVCWANPPDLANAARFRFSGIGYVYQRPRSLRLTAMAGQAGAASTPGLPLAVAIQQQMFARRKPVSVAVPVVWSAWPWSGEVGMPSPSALAEFVEEMSPPNVAGWHCIAVCGWDNTTGRFLFKNSWGPWGDAGYGTIPYQYIELYSDVAMVGW